MVKGIGTRKEGELSGGANQTTNIKMDKHIETRTRNQGCTAHAMHRFNFSTEKNNYIMIILYHLKLLDTMLA